jgi:hypothetical protein
VEGKIAQTLDSPNASDPRHTIRAGWLDSEEWKFQPAKADPGKTLVSVYGQSFAFRVADRALALNPSLQIRRLGGPAAPLSHSVAALARDLPRHSPDVVVLGVLASSLTAINNLSMLGRTFESPAPYTFPDLSNHSGAGSTPEFLNFAEFSASFRAKDARWGRFRSQVLAREPGVDGFAFDQTPLDHSLLVRFIRRGWVTHLESNAFLGPTDLQKAAARQALAQAVALTQARQIPLVVLLFHDQGQGQVLDALLADPAKAGGATVISSSSYFSSDNPSNYLPDSHFTPVNDEILASALNQQLGKIAINKPAH